MNPRGKHRLRRRSGGGHSEGRIVVTPSDQIRGRYRLEELLARMPDEYEPSEEGWGAPVGREAW
jgi:antitoxin MazE